LCLDKVNFAPETRPRKFPGSETETIHFSFVCKQTKKSPTRRDEKDRKIACQSLLETFVIKTQNRWNSVFSQGKPVSFLNFEREEQCMDCI